MTTRPTVAAVIATYDRVALLGDCLASVAASLADDDELVVAEGGGLAAADVVAAVGRPVTHLAVTPPGKSRQLNAAVRRTSADLLLFTDDDCRVAPGWAEAMARPFEDPGVHAVLGPVVGLSGVPGSGPVPSPPAGPAPLATWTYAHGASLAVRRPALLAVGGFDERLGPGARVATGEDHDVLLRLLHAGGRAVIADAPAVAHLGWRDESADRANALAYERGAGAFVGAALRREHGAALTLLKHRLGYQRQLLATAGQRTFGGRALLAFAGGLGHGLGRRPWPADALTTSTGVGG